MKTFKTVILLATLSLSNLTAESHVRARDLGITFDGSPGAHNAITNVPGVLVGYSTIVEEEPNTVRTGVTAILPSGKDTFKHSVMSDWYTLNGNGEMTGTTWLRDSGFLSGPIMVTNTHSVGQVHHSTIKWAIEQNVPNVPSLPVVAETWDGFLNDINGLHVKEKHVYEALDNAHNGFIAEGCVGSGTGMICYQFKGGVGTSSRKINIHGQDYTVGVWVQANHGLRDELVIRGHYIGKKLPPKIKWKKDAGSIIVVVATNAPLIQNQLNRVARRASLGLARTGSIAHNSSGDIFIAFSTANTDKDFPNGKLNLSAIKNSDLDPVFTATVNATEEAIINALVAAESMSGLKGFHVPALPKGVIKDIFSKE